MFSHFNINRIIQAALPSDRVPVSPQPPVPLSPPRISPSPPIPPPLTWPLCRRCDGECRQPRPRPWRHQARPQLRPPAAASLSPRRSSRSPGLAVLCPQLRRILLRARSVLARPALCVGGCHLRRGYQEPPAPAASSPGPGQRRGDDSQAG